MSFILFLMLCSLSSHAQHVLIPDPTWPLDSVVNSSVHFYTVQGDDNYTDPSSFVWTVEGGRLFFDQNLTSMAGDGTTATVPGSVNNSTQLWVVWDSFDTPLDTGYVYVYEISSNGCQRSDLDAGKFKGMRIKVSAPPNARFIGDQTIVCADNDSGRVIMEIEGMPPFDLTYSVNGDRHDLHVTSADLADWDHDGEVNNLSFFHTNFTGITADEVYFYEIISVSSGGVQGKILPDYPNHTLIAHVQPTAPEILPEWTEVTTGTANVYNYQLLNWGVSPEEWFWTLRDVNSNLVNTFNSTTNPTYPAIFNSQPGLYYFEVQYRDTYGCMSPFDRLDIELFSTPTIQFAGNDTIISCSESSLAPDSSEVFEFVVEYYGARNYGFTYEVYDYNGNLVDGGSFNDQTNRTNIITIQNRFINDELPEDIRPWKVKIISADNDEPNIDVNILDSAIDGGRDERVILIYPKPFIHDDIDFAN